MLSLGRKRKLRHSVKADSKELQALKAKHENEQELFQAYEAFIIGGLNQDVSDESVWKELTKQQQILAALSVFVAQVNNGGVWQFLFNRPEFSVVIGEALDSVYRTSPLLPKYIKVLREFTAMHRDGRWAALMEKLQDLELSDPEAWNVFVDGGKAVPSAEEFNTLFFDQSRRQRMYTSFNKFVDQNLDKLLLVKNTEEKPKTSEDLGAAPIKKKNAIPHFSQYLEQQLGTKPEEVGVYYTGRVSIDSQPTQLFLMKYKMPNGFEGMGVTGYFTLHLPELTMAEVMKMHKQHHKQKLVNIFYGAYLVNKTLAQDPAAQEIEPGLWEAFLRKVQSQTGGQIPVNVTFQEYFKMEGYEIVIYTGDLLYHRSKVEPPKDPQDVSTDKKDGFAGEPDRIFHADPRGTTFGGRGRPTEPVEGKHKLYSLVGGKFKLLKDNPWGF